MAVLRLSQSADQTAEAWSRAIWFHVPALWIPLALKPHFQAAAPSSPSHLGSFTLHTHSLWVNFRPLYLLFPTIPNTVLLPPNLVLMPPPSGSPP